MVLIICISAAFGADSCSAGTITNTTAPANCVRAMSWPYCQEYAKLSSDLKSFAGPVKEIKVLDSAGNLFKEKNNDKRFFEAAWMHKYNGKYYFSYSTGDSHNLVYAIGDNPNGPFTYKGVLFTPVEGWIEPPFDN